MNSKYTLHTYNVSIRNAFQSSFVLVCEATFSIISLY